MMVQIASRATSRVSAPVIFVSLGLIYDRHSGMVRRTRPQMCNRTSGNLEIPGSLVSLAPRNDIALSFRDAPTGPRKARPDDRLRADPESRDSGFPRFTR